MYIYIYICIYINHVRHNNNVYIYIYIYAYTHYIISICSSYLYIISIYKRWLYIYIYRSYITFVSIKNIFLSFSPFHACPYISRDIFIYSSFYFFFSLFYLNILVHSWARIFRFCTDQSNEPSVRIDREKNIPIDWSARNISSTCLSRLVDRFRNFFSNQGILNPDDNWIRMIRKDRSGDEHEKSTHNLKKSFRVRSTTPPGASRWWRKPNNEVSNRPPPLPSQISPRWLLLLLSQRSPIARSFSKLLSFLLLLLLLLLLHFVILTLHFERTTSRFKLWPIAPLPCT